MLSATETDFLALNSVATNYQRQQPIVARVALKLYVPPQMIALVIVYYSHTEGLGSPGPEPKPIVLLRNTFLFRRKIVAFNCSIPF